MRARIDVSEIEAQTKIRAKYLRALENEEWGLLPGPTFVKSFLRTYAQALGLDGRALVEEYRLQPRAPERAARADRRPRPRSARACRVRPGGAGPSRGYLALVGVVAIVIVLLIVGLLSGGGEQRHRRADGCANGYDRQARRGAPTSGPPRGRDATSTAATRRAVAAADGGRCTSA